MASPKPDLLVVVGPTAVGKTNLTIKLAQRLCGEIISADSMQVYHGMNIGTAKPSVAEQQGIPHHLIDLVDPTEDFSVARYQEMAENLIYDITSRSKVPILTGGTGFYVRAVVDNLLFDDEGKDEDLRKQLEVEAKQYGNEFLHAKLAEVDSETAERLHPNDVRRIIRALEVYRSTGIPFSRQVLNQQKDEPEFNPIMFGLTRNREHLYERINLRVDLMLKQGLVDEVRALMARGMTPESTSMQGIGYKQISRYLMGEYDYGEAVRLLKRDTRRYAKRQYTWFKRDERILWIDLDEVSETEALDLIISVYHDRLSSI